MILADTYSHRQGEEVISGLGLLDEVKGFADAPSVVIEPSSARKINQHMKGMFSVHGWAINPKIRPGYDLTINARKGQVGLTVQTGNITRAFYDLMKFQAMYLADQIDAAVLVLPSHEASKILGSNIASFSRVCSELQLFKHIITCPCLIISLGEQTEDEL